MKIFRPIVTLGLCASFTACAPANIPSDAAREWGFLTSHVWTWGEKLDQGCVSWMAKEAWASVQIFVETEGPCPRKDSYLALKGKGLSFDSFSDHLTFLGYWPWSTSVFTDLIVFDDKGMWVETLPCPYTLSSAEIGTMKIAAKQALKTAKTAGEEKMLTRINERLAVMDGTALSSSQGGCTDVPADRAASQSSRDLKLWVTD